MSGTDLGTIFASVDLKLSPLNAGVAQVRNVTNTIKAELNSIDKVKVGDSLKANLLGALPALTTVAGAIAGAGAAAVKMSADFESSLNKVRNNTTMTQADFESMKAAVIALGNESGASLDDLGEGMMHIANFGIQGADAVTVLREAMKSAVATGANVSGTADILAKALHEFGMQASDAGKAMNVMHLAAAEGNMTLEQFDQAAGPAMAEAANLGVSLTDVSAAMAALTRHGLDASEAATQVKDILVHIISPGKTAREELEKLSKTTGIDLVSDFSLAGVHAKGLTGVIDDVARATHGNGDEIYKLIQAQRGGLGAMILAGTGANDYKEILLHLVDALAGKLDPTTEGYNRTLQTFNQQVAAASNQIRTDFLPVGQDMMRTFKDLEPEVKGAADILHSLLQIFNALPAPIRDTAIAVGTLKAAATALSLVIGTENAGLIGRFGLLKAAEAGVAEEGVTAFAAGGPYLAALAAVTIAVLAIKSAWDQSKKAQADYAKEQKDIYANVQGPTVQQYEDNAAQLARAQDDVKTYTAQIASLQKGGSAAFTGNGESPSTAANEYRYALDQAQGNLQQAQNTVSALKPIVDAQNKAFTPGGATGYTKTMLDLVATPLGQHVGYQCGEAVSKALKANGIDSTVTAMLAMARHNKAMQVKPNAQGVYPEGTILYFAKGGGSSQQHFAVAFGNGKAVENTTAGGGGYHYRADRTVAQIAEEHGGQIFAFMPSAAAAQARKSGNVNGDTPDASSYQDLDERFTEATKGEAAQLRKKAWYQYLEDRKVNQKKALAVYRTTLKTIADKEAKAEYDDAQKQAKADAEVLKKIIPSIFAALNVAAPVTGMSYPDEGDAARQKSATDAISDFFGNHNPSKRLQTDIGNSVADLTDTFSGGDGLNDEDRDQQRRYSYNKQKNGSAYLDYLKTQKASEFDQSSDRAQALQQEIDNVNAPSKELAAQMADAQRNLWQKAGGDMHAYFQSVRNELTIQAEDWAKSGIPQAQIDSVVALKKTEIDADESASNASKSFEDLTEQYQEGHLSAAQYDAQLKALIATTNDPALKRQMEHQDRTAQADIRKSNPWNFMSEGLKGDIGQNVIGRVLDDMTEKGKKTRDFFKSFVLDMKGLIKELLKDWAMAQIFGGKYGGGFNFGAAGKSQAQGGTLPALAAIAGAFGGDRGGAGANWVAGANVSQVGIPAGAGAAAGGGASSALGLAGLFAKGGALGHVFGGSFAGGLGAAMPWIGGGMMLNSLLGNPLGKLFKHFHLFAKGGIVPGTGFHDSVPAMLTPGERVIPRGQASSGHGGALPPIVVNHYGDIHGVEGANQMGETIGWHVYQRLPVATADY